MGTLFEGGSKRRFTVMSDDIRAFLDTAKDVASDTKVPQANVIEAARVLEMRRANDIACDTAERVDELAAGFGEILQEAVRLASVWPTADD